MATMPQRDSARWHLLEMQRKLAAPPAGLPQLGPHMQWVQNPQTGAWEPHTTEQPIHGTTGQSSSPGGGIVPGMSDPAPANRVLPLAPGQFGYTPPGLPGHNNPPLINPAAPAGADYGPFTPPPWWPTRNINDPGSNPDPWSSESALQSSPEMLHMLAQSKATGRR